MNPEDSTLQDQVRALTARLAELERRVPAPATPPPEAETVARHAQVEAKLGGYWLSRLGILSLITGVAFLVIYRFGDLGPLLRVGLGYLLSAGLGAFGLWLTKRHLLFGRIVFSGGLATGYFVTYALHFVEAVRLIHSEVVALSLLAALIAGIIWVAHRMHSETVAGVALFLGLHTGMLNEVSTFTLLSTCLLAAGAVFFLIANRWVLVPLSTLVAVYSTHVTWMLARDHDAARAGLSLGFLAIYFALFSFAILVRPDGLRRGAHIWLPVLNAAGFTALGTWEAWAQGARAGFTFTALAALAHALLAAVALAREASRRLLPVFGGLALLIAAVCAPHELTGFPLTFAWVAVSLAASALTLRLGAPALRWLAPLVLSAALVRTGLAFAASRGPDFTLIAADFALIAVAFVFTERWVHALGAANARAARGVHAVGAGAALMLLFSTLLPPSLQTLAWVIASFSLFGLGFGLRAAAWRYAGFGVLVACLGRLVLRDLSRLGPDERIVSFIGLGVALLAVSFVYTRLQARTPPVEPAADPAQGATSGITEEPASLPRQIAS